MSEWVVTKRAMALNSFGCLLKRFLMDGSIPKQLLSLCWDRLSMGERMVLVSNKIEFSEQSCIGKGFPQDNILTLTEANKTEKQECNNILKISTHLIYLQIQIKLVWSLPKIDHLFSFICLLCKSDTDMSRCLAKCLFVPGWLWGLLYLAGQPYAPNVYSNMIVMMGRKVERFLILISWFQI